jgi:hypothetical protein
LSGRRLTGLTVALALLAGEGCYSYQTLTTPEPASGTPVSLVLSDEGRVAVRDSIGSGILRVEGTVVGASGNTWVVAVSDVQGIDGRVTKWTGETVGVHREYVAVPYERRFSRGKTALLISSLTVGMATFIATRHLLGISLPLIDSGSGGGGSNNQ